MVLDNDNRAHMPLKAACTNEAESVAVCLYLLSCFVNSLCFVHGDLQAKGKRCLDTFVFLLFFHIFILFIYFWLRWDFVAARGLSLVAASGGYSSLPCAGFSLRWLLLLQSTGSRRAGFRSCGSPALERRLSSCGTQA